ncbi:ABC transporter permease [Fulvivirga maritima]|uniref:ABC transporter permease n=1 Tax=Fulvivirga maritima TaxID=2904247 RepID=UPI001F26FF13|nr:ABC transporter permease [Fulvivirga maritima]UII26219.1 ABC transporter permease [Fulvivirga maritima]
MIKNYLKLTFRNLIKNRVSTIINLLGLTIGISTCVVIFLFINNELSFDKFNPNYDRIYRVVTEGINASGTSYESAVPSPMAEVLRNDLPQLEAVTRVYEPTDYQVAYEGEKWTQDDVMFADSMFLEVFNYPLVEKGAVKPLTGPNQVLITESVAKKHFGDNAIGAVFRLNHMEDVEVVGILQDPPANSHIQFSVIASYPTLSAKFIGFDIFSWEFIGGIHNYVKLPEQVTRESVDADLLTIQKKYDPDSENGKKKRYFLQPLSEVHFDQAYSEGNFEYTMDMTYIYVLACIGIFIMVIACVNFINLSTALAVKRAKEVGMRKVLGANRKQLIIQYLSEAFIITFLSALFSLGVVERSMPFINYLMGVQLSMAMVIDPTFIIFFTLLIIVVMLLSGLYPALILSSYNPARALKTKITDVNSTSLFLRKGLVTFQFMVSQVLIIATLVIATQMDYFKNKPLGFGKEHKLMIPFFSGNDINKLEAFKKRVTAQKDVQEASLALGAPTSDNNLESNFFAEGIKESMNTQLKAVDIDYKDTYDIQLLAGNWFTHEQKGLENYELVVNESMVRKIGFSNPEDALGKRIKFGIEGINAPIVGVVKDFHMTSLQSEIDPLVLFQYKPFYFELGVKINGHQMPETIADIEAVWNELFPGYVFEYQFLDEELAKNYESEQTVFSLFKIMSAIAISIGCLGLVGLVSFLVSQKSKEIGVRKVLGASVGSIFMLFGRGYIKLVFIAFIIAAPISWWAMQQWLTSFAYRISFTPLFLLAGVFINIVIAIATVGFQSIRAAMANPVDSLKDD